MPEYGGRVVLDLGLGVPGVVGMAVYWCVRLRWMRYVAMGSLCVRVEYVFRMRCGQLGFRYGLLYRVHNG